MGLLADEIAKLLRSEEISTECRIALWVLASILLLAVLAYVFFGIFFLVIDYHVCTGSLLWWWCLVVLLAFVLSVPLGIYHTANTRIEEFEDLEHNEKSKEDMWWKLVTMILFQGSLCIAGHVVMTGGYTCDHLHKTGLWTWSQISMHKLSIVTVYVLFVFIYMFYIMPHMDLDNYEEEEELSPTIINTDDGARKISARRSRTDERERLLLDDSNNGKNKGNKNAPTNS